MTKVNFAENRKKAEEAGLLGGGGVFKPKEGPNRFRLVSECIEHPGSFNGKPNFKWLCLVLDRADGSVKPYFMPNTVYEGIEALQLNPDYAFDEVPMPYDITLNAKGAGKKEVVYTVLPAASRTPLTEAEIATVKDAGSIRDYQKTVYENQSKEPEVVTESVPLPKPPFDHSRYDNIPQQFRPKA